MTKTDSKGFSIVEGLLILVAVGILGFTGWYVYHAKRASDKNYSAAANSTVPSYKKRASTKEATSSVFKVPELGIEITNVPSTLHDLTYQISNGSAAFSTQSLASSDPPACGTPGGVGSLDSTSGTYPPTQTNLTVFIKQFSGFWVSYAPDNDQCWGAVTNAQKQSQVQSLARSQRQAFDELVSNPTNIQAIN